MGRHNGDDIAQGERGCVFHTAGCEINFAALPTNFGVRSLAQFDPELASAVSRYAFNVGITHEVLTGLTMTFEYFRTDSRNVTVRQNSLRDANSYDRFDVVSPLDGSVIPAYVVKPAFAARVANIDSTSDEMQRSYNGFELGFNARMAGGIRAFGGFNMERTLNDVCVSAASDPNRSLYCDQRESGIPWQKQFKGTLVYPLPWYGISFSAAFQSLNGYLSGTAVAGVRRLHGRHRLRSSERPRHVLAGNADHALRGELHRAVHARRPGAAGVVGERSGLDQRSAGGAGNGVHAAHQPVDLSASKRFEFAQDHGAAEDGPVQRVELGRLHERRDGAVRRGDLPAAVDRAAGPDHPHRRGRQVVNA